MSFSITRKKYQNKKTAPLYHLEDVCLCCIKRVRVCGCEWVGGLLSFLTFEVSEHVSVHQLKREEEIFF